MLDSGVFTFMNTGTKVDFDEYIDKYIEFINKYNIKKFFELDLYDVKGIDYVEGIRKKLEKETGKQPIPVFHKSCGIDYYKKLCCEYNYVAIGGIAIGDIKKTEYNQFLPMVKYAHQQKTKVHGLGFTDFKWLKKIPFDSVDSSSWTSGWRYGIMFSFDLNSNTMQMNKPKNKRVRDGKALNRHNFYQWCKYQEYADRRL